jgi:acetyl esterase/lipase
MIRNVSIPSLTAFLPEGKATDRTAIIICPGGAFRWLTWQNEGTDLAKWFAARGVAAFVLKYRLVPTATDSNAFEQESKSLEQESG